MRILDWIFTTTLVVLMVVIEYTASINYPFMYSIMHPTIFWGGLGTIFEGKNRKSVMKNAEKCNKEFAQIDNFHKKGR